MIYRCGDDASYGGAEKENHFEQVYYVWGIKYDVRSKVTHLLSGDRVLLHIFLGAFATEVATDFAKGGCFFEKTDNFSLILPNFSKKVHDFFAKGVERK